MNTNPTTTVLLVDDDVELTRVIVEVLRRDGFDVPFIFLSAASDAATVKRAAELGAITYLVKPVQIEQYGPAIQSALAWARELRKSRAAESRLEQALAENRVIGLAVGLLLERSRTDRITAFEMLRDDARAPAADQRGRRRTAARCGVDQWRDDGTTPTGRTAGIVTLVTAAQIHAV